MDDKQAFAETRPFKSRFSRAFKLTALVLLGTFLSRDIVWSADYSTPSNQVREDQRRTAAGFAPAYVKEQQEKHDQFVQERNDAQEIRSSSSAPRSFIDRVRELIGQERASVQSGTATDGEESLLKNVVDTVNSVNQVNLYAHNERGGMNAVVSYGAAKIQDKAENFMAAAKEARREPDRSDVKNENRSTTSFFKHRPAPAHPVVNIDLRADTVDAAAVTDTLSVEPAPISVMRYLTDATLSRGADHFELSSIVGAEPIIPDTTPQHMASLSEVFNFVAASKYSTLTDAIQNGGVSVVWGTAEDFQGESAGAASYFDIERNSIIFNSRYAQESTESLATLLVHEATHVLQGLQGRLNSAPVQDLELEAFTSQAIAWAEFKNETSLKATTLEADLDHLAASMAQNTDGLKDIVSTRYAHVPENTSRMFFMERNDYSRYAVMAAYEMDSDAYSYDTSAYYAAPAVVPAPAPTPAPVAAPAAAPEATNYDYSMYAASAAYWMEPSMYYNMDMSAYYVAPEPAPAPAPVPEPVAVATAYDYSMYAASAAYWMDPSMY